MIEADEDPLVIRVVPPKKTDILIIRFLISCGAACMIIFLFWFINRDHVGHLPLFILLTFALSFKLLKMLHEWYHYWSPSIPEPPQLKTKWTVDMLTTFCPGEPYDMMDRTLRAMVAVKYPHKTYLCDEADDPQLKKLCEELGIVHVTRKEKINAKAGNINNALKQATGDICIVMDPDHVPIPEFIDRVLPYFEDSSVGYVQSVQAYGNQGESIIARGAAEQTYHFYGPMMMSMNTYGTVQAIGANCAFRRTALDSIGGHAPGLSEDMHTAMRLHAQGWKSLYIPEILTRGLVPATLSAYYKQQLKWSRGTFELLFRTIPDLWKNLSWRQKIHYITIPMYFLFGLVNFIDILVPLLALCFAEVPWAVDVPKFASCYFPLCMISLLTRFYAQRWLLEKHERGFHLAGGLLRTATWWIFLVGFIYSIFNIKVPYIPTPKEDEHQNYWRLSLINIGVIFICLAGSLYGLSIDWSPYSMAMATFSCLNALILTFIVIMSQQKLIENAFRRLMQISFFNSGFKLFESVYDKLSPVLYGSVKNGAVALTIAFSILFMGYSNLDKDAEMKDALSKEKKLGGFYFGMNALPGDPGLVKTFSFSNGFTRNTDLVIIEEGWNSSSPSKIDDQIKKIDNRGSIPMIVWKPDTKTDKICTAICSGKYDAYLRKHADLFRKFKNPVFISFAPGFDNKEKSWSAKGHNTSTQFIKAWQYVYSYFNNLGVSNVSWVWNPETINSFEYFPGPEFVDWIGVSCLNFGNDKKHKDWKDFAELFETFKNKFSFIRKPFMITEFGCARGPYQNIWFAEAFDALEKSFPEVKSVALFNDKKTANDIIDFRIEKNSLIAMLDHNLKSDPFEQSPIMKVNLNYKAANTTYKSKFITGRPGTYQMLIDSKPFYVKGIAYNTAHDWRDGNMPLTRKQIVSDFKKMKAMGANTVRRYGSSIYNTNILNIAEENGLKVIYGFWFDPKVDYYRDTARVKEYIEEVEREVKKFKGHSSLLAWSLGNETWGLLKHTFGKPYLTKVREHYVKLIEHLAQRVHEIDPHTPVFSSMEHEFYQLPSEVVAFHDGAPSVDVIGVNSYYKEQISDLFRVNTTFDPTRPYLISEFGPSGYWTKIYNKYSNNGLLAEESESEKADWLKYQWNNFVIAKKGYNVGGIAYCWHDRMEGSLTWFGLSDYKGRIKAGYYSLCEVWTGKKTAVLPEFSVQPCSEIIAGKTCKFKAVTFGGRSEDLTYEWSLNKDGYLKKMDIIESTSEETAVNVQIPTDPADYTLYLYVSDDKGNVTTANVPFRITKK